MRNVHWRNPTQAALDVVGSRLSERQVWQALIQQRADYQQEPETYERLSPRQRETLDDRFEVLDAKIAADKTLLYFPFDKQIPFHNNILYDDPTAPAGKSIKAKVRLADCGNRSGKTIAGSVEAVWWAQGNHPYIFTPAPPITVWFVCLDFPQSEDINKPLLEEWMPKGTVWSARGRSWKLPNGSEIILKSQEAKRGKFQGGNIPLIVWDEEGVDPEESKKIYEECLVRTWDQAGQIVMTLTPIEQYAWICDLIQSGRDGDQTIEVHTWSGLDNPYVPSEEIQSMKFDSEEEAQVRIHGALIPLGTRTIFDKTQLRKWHAECRAQEFDWGVIKKGQDDRERWQFLDFLRSDESTEIKIFEKPNKTDLYIAGIDTGGGIGENYSVMIIMARFPLRVVCVYRTNTTDVDSFGIECMMLGQAYFQHPIDRPCLLVAEENNHGHGLLSLMVRMHYLNLWYAPKEMKPGYDEFPGWKTTIATRPVMEGAVQVAVEQNAIRIRDPRIVEECLRYEMNPVTKKTGAPRGQNDDCVIALGVGLAVHTLTPIPPWMLKDDEPAKLDTSAHSRPTAKELRKKATRSQWREGPAW